MLIVSGFDSVTVDNVVDFGHHEDTHHFFRPALEVLPIKVRDGRDGESGGRLVGSGHVDGWLISERKRTWMCQQADLTVCSHSGALHILRLT